MICQKKKEEFYGTLVSEETSYFNEKNVRLFQSKY